MMSFVRPMLIWLARQWSNRPWRAGLLLLSGVAFLYATFSVLHQDRALPYDGGNGNLEPGLWRPWGGTANNGLAKTSVCEMYPDTGNIAISIKTGASEASEKMAATLRTSLSCAQDIMIFSDLEQTLGDLHMHDVLSRYSQEAMENNTDFDLYRKQKDLVFQHRESEIVSLAQELVPPRDGRRNWRPAGWVLDKYKFVHLLEAAYDLQPDKDWYVFLEADTYLSWPNLKRWLSTLDPKRKLYLGKAIRKSNSEEPFFFAHGGAGFVLSRAAMKEYVTERKDAASRMESRIHSWFAGDMMLADSLYEELSLRATDVAPMFNNLDSRAVPFWDDSWCEPAITLHHMDAEDFDEIYQLERSLGFSRLLLRDVYATVYPSGLPSKRSDWDNVAEDRRLSLEVVPIQSSGEEADTALNPHNDFESCKTACERNEKCFQSLFRNTTVAKSDTEVDFLHHCYLSSAFRLGHAKPLQSFDNEMEPGTYRSWTSGWQNDKIEKWVKNREHCASDHDWVTD